MPSAKTEMAWLSVPGSKPAATRSLFFTRTHPGPVTISLAPADATMRHCCARRVAAGADGAAGVTPMPGAVVKIPPTDPTPGSGSVTVPDEVPVPVVKVGVIGPCMV